MLCHCHSKAHKEAEGKSSSYHNCGTRQNDMALEHGSMGASSVSGIGQQSCAAISTQDTAQLLVMFSSSLLPRWHAMHTGRAQQSETTACVPFLVLQAGCALVFPRSGTACYSSSLQLFVVTALHSEIESFVSITRFSLLTK